MKANDIRRLAAAGKIVGYEPGKGANLDDLLPRGGKNPNRPTGARIKEKFKAQISLFCVVYKMCLLEEQRFHPERKWRFDFVVVGRGKAQPLEYEGIFNGESRHTHQSSYTEDVEKYNEATMAGIPPLRYTARTVQNVFRDLEKMFKINS